VIKKILLTFILIFFISCGGNSSTGSNNAVIESISPSRNEEVLLGAVNYKPTLDISANISGSDFSLAECFLDGESLGLKSSSGPFNWSVNILDEKIPSGYHSISLILKDSSGNEVHSLNSTVKTKNTYWVRVQSMVVAGNLDYNWYITPVTSNLDPFYNQFYGTTQPIGNDGDTSSILVEGRYNLKIYESTGRNIADVDFTLSPDLTEDWYLNCNLGVSENSYTLSID